MLLPDINHTQKLVIKNILQGQQLVSADPNCAITTILGSCVAACMYDPIARVGGMNHFLLPDAEGAQSNNLAYGINSMELLVNDMLKKGASRQNIHVKLIGGATMVRGLSDVGQRNIVFARDFTRREGFKVVSESLGGSSARRIRFWPTTGKAQLKIVQNFDVSQETKSRKITPPDNDGDIELF